uniref:uncharacterized protein LOC101297504 n=1 Tax=Fragaria vesca subsp. vesca TaxID=101020 RepID=UPI0005C843F1|nr:PREDICTED: uncharacterized protein LOC101297504 [Fragaria vesca subsp. vesca]
MPHITLTKNPTHIEGRNHPLLLHATTTSPAALPTKSLYFRPPFPLTAVTIEPREESLPELSYRRPTIFNRRHRLHIDLLIVPSSLAAGRRVGVAGLDDRATFSLAAPSTRRCTVVQLNPRYVNRSYCQMLAQAVLWHS